MDEPDPADADERVDDEAELTDPPSRPAGKDDSPLKPGDSDLADAWWAR